MTKRPDQPIRGRGALSNPDNRFDTYQYQNSGDGWGDPGRSIDPEPELIRDHSRSIITRNRSPDVPFEQSINPYRGCEHGCIYCFARPTHAYLGYSPGLDFETKLHYKPDAAGLLREALARPGYDCKPIALGVNTDAYQPAEKRLGITRAVLEVLAEHNHPVAIITKSSLVERDLDILQQMAQKQLVSLMVSITTLDQHLSRHMEPRANSPRRRLQLIETLNRNGIPTGLMMAPLIPFLNDHEIKPLLQQARDAGAREAVYVLLRLPHEVRELFTEWLHTHLPEKAARIIHRLQDCRDGKAYDSRFGIRMRGEGIYADLIAKRFRQAHEQLRFGTLPALSVSEFTLPPEKADAQLSLFDDTPPA